MAKEEGDDDTMLAIQTDTESMKKEVEDLEFRRMFSNEMDPCSCFLDIQAGAGGTEACDWASMLLRQYLRYCERKGLKAEVLEQSESDKKKREEALAKNRYVDLQQPQRQHVLGSRITEAIERENENDAMNVQEPQSEIEMPVSEMPSSGSIAEK